MCLDAYTYIYIYVRVYVCMHVGALIFAMVEVSICVLGPTTRRKGLGL